MDPAVALVEAYLYANGYFTVTEYPVIEAIEHGDYRAATDVDVLAVRFPGAGRLVPRRGNQSADDVLFTEPDPALGAPGDRIDMIIGEVKEGRAELNRGARNPQVLRAVLTRFGACTSEHADDLVSQLIRRGEATAPSGPEVRLIAFGTHASNRPQRFKTVTLGHVVEFIRGLADEHWKVVQQMQFKHTALGFMMVLEKALRSVEAAD